MDGPLRGHENFPPMSMKIQMQMDFATFQRNFPSDVPIPEKLRQLLEFQNQLHEWYSGHFELDHWRFGDVAIFDGDDSVARQFVVFGRTPDGSLYAFWLYPGRPTGMPPIVHVCADGAGSLVADNLDGFLSLLAMGAEDLGRAIDQGGPFKPAEPAPRLAEFRTWLLKRFGIRAPGDPMRYVIAARVRHPNFSNWMKKWRDSWMVGPGSGEAAFAYR